MQFISLAEALRCAGSFEALARGVVDTRMLTCFKSLQHAESGNRWSRKDDDDLIPPWWWDPEDGNPRLVDVASGRVLFAAGVAVAGSGPPDDLLAIGVELEAGMVDALWPPEPEPVAMTPDTATHQPTGTSTDATSPIPKPEPVRDPGGREPEHAWEDAARYVDKQAEKNPLPRKSDGSPNVQRAIDLMLNYYKKYEPPPPPNKRSIRRWIKNNPSRVRGWWDRDK